ncbi:MAG: retropepsin-like aspartic protease [Cyclobacteriaceae bacterium]
MKKCIAIILLLLSAIIAYAQEYPIHIMEEGHIVVGVTINDSIPANFILDTGAGIMILSGKMYERIKDKVKSAGYHTGFRHDGDKISGEIYQVPSFAIGNERVENLKMGVYPPLDGMGIDGLVSMKFFEDKPFTIDYPNGKLIFQDPNSLMVLAEKGEVGQLGFHRNMDVSLDISIPICINDKVHVNAQFDTGSGHDLYVVNPFFMQQLGMTESNTEASTYTTPISGTEIKDYIAKENKLRVCGTSASITSSIVFREGLIMEALVGSGIFKEGAITIDIPSARFIIHK